MSKLRIKDEYQGLSISQNVWCVGLVTLDTTTAKPEKYHKYKELGFNIFEEVEEEVKEEYAVMFDEKAIKEVQDKFISEMKETELTYSEDEQKAVKHFLGLDETFDPSKIVKWEEKFDVNEYHPITPTPKKKRQLKKDKVKQEPDQE